MERQISDIGYKFQNSVVIRNGSQITPCSCKVLAQIISTKNYHENYQQAFILMSTSAKVAHADGALGSVFLCLGCVSLVLHLALAKLLVGDASNVRLLLQPMAESGELEGYWASTHRRLHRRLACGMLLAMPALGAAAFVPPAPGLDGMSASVRGRTFVVILI